MAKIIHTIIHPFFGQLKGDFTHRVLEGNNRALYDKIIDDVDEDPESLLYYIATVRDVDKWQNNQLLFRPEIELQQQIRELKSDNNERVAIFADYDGEEAITTGLYRPEIIIPSGVEPELIALSWFAEHGVTSHYDRSMTTIYTDITGADEEYREDIRQKLRGEPFHEEEGRTYMQMPLHPQVAKVINFLEPVESDRRILDESTLTLSSEVKETTQIIGSGEYLDACVFDHSVGISIALGIPPQNVILNDSQPHIIAEGKQGQELWQRPVEMAFRPPIWRK